MPEDPPMVLVQFYSNFHYRETDISDVIQGLGGQQPGTRNFNITERIMEIVKEKEPPFTEHLVFKEERSYNQTLNILYNRVSMGVLATEGTWAVEIQWGHYEQVLVENAEGHLEPVDRSATVSDPIGPTFNAASVLAAMAGKTEPPLEDSDSSLTDPGDPMSLFMEVEEFPGEERPPEFSFHLAIRLEGVPGFIQVVDIGENEVEFRLFLFGGIIHTNEADVFVRMVNIDLAGVIEKVPEADIKTYELPLEFGCEGSGVPVKVPKGVVKPEGGTTGAKAHHRPVSGTQA